MGNGTEKRSKRNGEFRAWVALAISIAVLLGAIISVWIGASNKDAAAAVRIEHLEDTAADLKSVPADIAGILAVQEAQQTTLTRIDRTLEKLAQGK